MVNVKFDKSKQEITIKGHAEYDKKGKDIVCAGISTLVLMMEVYFQQACDGDKLLPKGTPRSHKCQVKEGNSFFKYSPTNFTSILFVEYFIKCFQKYEASFPKYLKVTVINNKQESYNFDIQHIIDEELSPETKKNEQ